MERSEQDGEALRDRTVLAQLVELTRASTVELKAMWRRIMHGEPPAYSRAFILKRLAYRIQEQVYGGVSQRTLTRLRAAVEDAGYSLEDGRLATTTRRRGQLPPPGTMVTKKYGEQVFRLVVLAGGACELDGRRFRSISAAARAITNRFIDGYVFFGLNRKKAKKETV